MSARFGEQNRENLDQNRPCPVLAGSLVPASLTPASADYYGGGPGPGAAFAAGLATGIIGMGIAGSAPAPYYYGAYDDPRCHPGPLECRTYAPPCYNNEYGEYVCPPPARSCFRRPICY
jgi:hypothetical protein